MFTEKKLNLDFNRFCEEWNDSQEYNTYIYNYFKEQVTLIPFLSHHFESVSENDLGYGEKAFRYLWLLVFNSIPNNSKFLEIGVYKGSILALSQLCSLNLKKNIKCFGVTPLTPIGDKYTVYPNENYDEKITFLYSLLGLDRNNTNIIKGISTDDNVKKEVIFNGPYDVIYIDGGHDYETVINDIELSDYVLKKNGLLIMDDSSTYLNFEPNFEGFKGHEDVSKAIIDKLDKKNNYKHLFACGHNRVWVKI